MTDQIVNQAIRNFFYAFLDCQTFFIFDNTIDYACFTKNALLTKEKTWV